VVTNYVFDRAGCTFGYRMGVLTAASLFQTATTYLVFDNALGGEDIRKHIFSLDNQLSSERQYDILLQLEGALGFLCQGALKYGRPLPFQASICEKYRTDVEDYFKTLASLVEEQEWLKTKEEAELLTRAGVAEEMAAKISVLSYLKDFLPVASLVEKTGMDIYSIAQTYKELQERFEIKDVLARLEGIPLRDNWDRMAKQTLISRILTLGYRLTDEIWENANGNLESFLARRRPQFDVYRKLKLELNRTNSLNFNPFAVLIQALEEVLPSGLGR
jgi:glutamate dehydrogenase